MFILRVRVFIGSLCLYYTILGFQSCKNSCWMPFSLTTVNKIILQNSIISLQAFRSLQDMKFSPWSVMLEL